VHTTPLLVSDVLSCCLLLLCSQVTVSCKQGLRPAALACLLLPATLLVMLLACRLRSVAALLLLAARPCVKGLLSFVEGKTALAVAVAATGAVPAADRKPGAAVDKLLNASSNFCM
jgi:hypothetical protein